MGAPNPRAGQPHQHREQTQKAAAEAATSYQTHMRPENKTGPPAHTDGPTEDDAGPLVESAPTQGEIGPELCRSRITS